MKTRREFLSLAAGAAGAIYLANATTLHGAEERNLRASWKVGITDWDIRTTGRLESFTIAKELGYEGVQVSYQPEGPDSLADKANRPRFLAAAKETEVAIASFCIGQLNGKPLATTPEAEGWVADCLEAMDEMNVPQVLIPFFGNGDLDTQESRQYMPVIIDKFKRLAAIAERKKKILAIESTLSAEAHIGLIAAIGSDAVKVYYDTLNTRNKGFDIYHEIDLLGSKKLISEIHFKEGGARLGDGGIDFAKVCSLLEKHGFEGWIVVEGSVTGDWKESHTANAQFIKRLLGR